jgi:DNA-directed RNA polymerase subunit RPC12/RpoP
MRVINFDCHKCGQNIDAPDSMAGLIVECPACSGVIRIPKASSGDSTANVKPDSEKLKSSTIRIELPSEKIAAERRKKSETGRLSK